MKGRKFFAWLLIFAIVLNFPDFCVNVKAEETKNLFTGYGKGTEGDPYQITTAEQLMEICNDLSAFYVLKNDIDLSKYENWKPIGNSDNMFSGVLDGNGYQISGLHIDVNELGSYYDPKYDYYSVYLGLFSYGDHAIFKNLNLCDINIILDCDAESNAQGQVVVGGLVASRYMGMEIINCSVSGKIDLRTNLTIQAGGIAGWGITFKNCVNKVDINCLNRDDVDTEDNSCSTYVQCGGLTSDCNSIINCINYGNITVNSLNEYVGVGGIANNVETIQKCINYGGINVKQSFTDSWKWNRNRTCLVAGIASHMGKYNFGGSTNNSSDLINYGNIECFGKINPEILYRYGDISSDLLEACGITAFTYGNDGLQNSYNLSSYITCQAYADMENTTTQDGIVSRISGEPTSNSDSWYSSISTIVKGYTLDLENKIHLLPEKELKEKVNELENSILLENSLDRITLPISSELPIDGEASIISIDNSEITIQANDYDTLIGGELEGADAEIEGIGTATTDSKGMAHITNSLTEPSAMKRICVKKDGYRDYIFYTTIVSPDMVNLFSTNQLYACLKKKQAEDDINPYVSTVMYYRDGVAKTCGGQHFQKSDTVTFRACGVWNDKQPGYYCMYQVGGKSFESEDGIFKLNIGASFSGSDDIYVKMIAKDGTESEPEQVYITVPEGDSNISDDSYIPILNESAESSWLPEYPFLNDDKLSFDLGEIKTTIKRDGSKVRIMLGKEIKKGSKDIFDDKMWEDWRKFCESQPKDLSLSQWKEVLSSDNLDTHWTSKAKIKATGYGWLENDLSADSTTPLTGGIQVVIDMSTTFKQQYAVGVIPVYLEESIGVKGELGGSVTFDTKEKKFGGKTNAKITPSLSVGGGVGVLYVATVGAEGSASMPMKIDFPKGLTQADLEGSLSLKASVLGFNYSKEMVKATYPLYPSKSYEKSIKKLMKQGSNDFVGELSSEALYNMDNYVLPEKTESTAKWYGDSTKKKAAKQSSAIASNLTETLLQTGTSELSEPILVQEGNTTLAVFLTEDGSRETIHRAKLVYTVYDQENGTWSSLKAVDEDGTGDFQPYLTASNGHIVVSWLNYDSKVTDSSSMKEALRSSEICYAVWSENTKSFVKAADTLSSTKSVSYNSTHAYMDTEGNVAEVGLKNTGADIFGTTGNNVLFMTGKCGDKTINQEFTLTQGIPVTYDVTGTEEVLTAAVCLDTDKDLTTLEDREIYLFSSNGTVKRLTDNNTYDASPQYAKYQGKNALFWYTEQGYKVLDEDGTQSDIMKDDNTTISENFTVVNGEKKETAIVWSGVDKDSVYQLTACIYDEDSDRWSRQVVLSDSEENIFRPSGYFNADGDMEFIYRKGSTVDKGSLYTLQVSQAPDLGIIDAYIKDGTAIPGKDTKVYVAVRNLGTKKITDYSISVDGQETASIDSILPGESKLLEVNYTLSETISYGEIPVEVSVTDDRDTSNNTFSLAMGYSDVSVSATEEELEKGRIVHVTVQNTETVSTDAVLEVHKNAKDGELLSSMKLGNLKQGDIATTDFIYQKQGSDYEVDADALYYVVTSSAVEKYESNNYDYTVFNTKESGDSGDITPTPSPWNTTKPTQKPSVTPTQKPDSQLGGQTPTPFPSSTVMPTDQPTALPTNSSTITIGTKTTVGKMKYNVTKVNNNGTGEVTLIGTTRKKSDKRFTSLKVGNTVKIKGKSFKITAIGNNAFRGYKKLKSVTVAKNIKKIGTKAFYGCKKLKKIVIKTKQLQAKKVGNKAFKGIYSKVNIKVPKPKFKSYKKILKAKGVGKRAKIHT